MYKLAKNALLVLAFGITGNTFAQSDTAQWSIRFVDLSTPMRLLGPDKIIRVSDDSVLVYKPRFRHNRDGHWKRTEDTLVYATGHQLNITPLITAIDSLERGYFNLCIHGGLCFHFQLKYSGYTHETWISNYYQPQIFAILDAINPLLPGRYQIGYDRESMEKKWVECEKYLNP